MSNIHQPAPKEPIFAPGGMKRLIAWALFFVVFFAIGNYAISSMV